MTEVVDSNACARLDNAVETLSFLRYLVLGSILAHRVYMLLPDDYCGKHPAKALLLASWRFATTEGEHMLIYFGVSCLLDNAKIFVATSPSADICRADMLVSLYAVALLAFLPNAFLARKLKRRDLTVRYHPCVFASLAAATAGLSFVARLRFVEESGYLQAVHSLMATAPVLMRIVAAASVPPIVDCIQALVLIAVTGDRSTNVSATYESLAAGSGTAAPRATAREEEVWLFGLARGR